MSRSLQMIRFRIALAEHDRGLYDSLKFQVALHPSEGPAYLISRVLAYSLNYAPGIVFAGGGLSDREEPAIRVVDGAGGTSMWIEIGQPTTKRLSVALRNSEAVRVYAYKAIAQLESELTDLPRLRGRTLEIFAIDFKFLETVAKRVESDNEWSVNLSGGALLIGIGQDVYETVIAPVSIVTK